MSITLWSRFRIWRGAAGVPCGHTETVNDADGLLCNFWRAMRADPDAVAEHADYPVSEADAHARHRWLVAQRRMSSACWLSRIGTMPRRRAGGCGVRALGLAADGAGNCGMADFP